MVAEKADNVNRLRDAPSSGSGHSNLDIIEQGTATQHATYEQGRYSPRDQKGLFGLGYLPLPF